MQIQIIIAVYFLALIVIGVFSFFKIKTPGDYYVAGKKAGFIPVSGSLLATLLGGSAILGTIELGQQIGWAALWLLFSAASGLLFLVPLSKYVKRFGNFTLPELLGKFYGKRAEIIASAVIPVAWLGIVAAQIIAAAKILSGLHIVSYYPAAIVSGVVFIVYTLIGGQHSIIKTDTIQSVLIIAGIILITFYAVEHPTSGEVEHFSPTLLFNNNFKPFDLLILLLTYSVTFVVGPDIYSRLFCAKDEKTASKSVLTVALILIPLSFALTYLGIYSNTVESAGIIDFAEHLLPGWMYGLFLAALLSAVMSSADTTLLTSSIILGELASGDLSGKSSIKLTRFLVVILGVTSILIALFVNSVIQSLLFALTLFSGAFTVPTLFGLLRIKVDNRQIIPAIVSGGTIALTGKIVNTYFNDLTGNIIIIFSFLISTIILFSTTTKKQRK
ncbi:sodium:solute symporter family protein [Maribellus comscasis]|uniref:Sodium:solute symporter family protein n=1 Tax=Maribellus comscasis TaxID=2681766 RepID=A0A6I6JWC2_9BACT|nr:sodium:solute symporter family protein [Maribellus comscasis]QGY47426.1 sodium:solute symporter family protein [Maribellus comscasis]